MKKLTSLVLALGLTLFTIGCGKPADNATAEPAQPAETETPAEDAPADDAPADDAGSAESGSGTTN